MELLYDPVAPATMRSPFSIYRRLRDEAPVHYVEERGFWVLSRFEDDEIAKLGLAPTIVMMDPPRQRVLRALVSRGFTPRRVADLEAPIRAFVVERLGRLLAAGEGDLIGALAGPLPTFAVAYFLGVPEDDRDRFDGWSHAIVEANAQGSVIHHAAAAIGDLYRYFTQIIEARERDPRDDMISVLIGSEVDGERLSVQEILGFCFVMIAGGNDTTTGLIGGAAELLTERRDQRQLLMADPSRIAPALDEFLRLTSPVQGLCRTTTREVKVRDSVIPEGRKVHLLYAAANRDVREFGPTADELDVLRTVRRHLAFSSGPHFCLGSHVARLQAQIVLEELLTRMPEFVVDADAGRYAPGAFVRRFEYLPIRAKP